MTYLRSFPFLLAFLLLLTACDTVEPEFNRDPDLSLSDPWLTEFGDRGGVTVEAYAPEPTRLRVVFAETETVLDTTFSGALRAEPTLPYVEGWGRPPSPKGDCYVATLGEQEATACPEERSVSFPTATPQTDE